jgi:hypothetical protein
MNNFSRLFIQKYLTLAAVLPLILFSACHKSAVHRPDESPAFVSFQDIPGVTEDEIRAIGALREKTPFFIYGMSEFTETFFGKDDKIGGYSVRRRGPDYFCGRIP